tara:strand:+ start:666 stop:950 length:285 start_codon:yes stop_codon:yes gene_type:complete
MATLKKLKADYEFWCGAYASVACNAELKDSNWVRDIARASRLLTLDKFNAYLDELVKQEKTKRTREALDQVMETIAPTETPLFTKPKSVEEDKL